MKKLCELLGKELLFFDGGTGTVLQELGLKPGELPETWNTKHPERIVQLNYNYFAAGSNIVNTNTFGAFITKFPLELERLIKAADLVKKTRQKLLSAAQLTEPFDTKGLFRTKQTEHYWNAAFSENACALEFFTDEDTATYLYRFSEPKELFIEKLREATEAMGIHREIIYLPQEQLEQNPLYRMAVDRSEAVRFLRARSDGRLIHNANHKQRLAEYLGTQFSPN